LKLTRLSKRHARSILITLYKLAYSKKWIKSKTRMCGFHSTSKSKVSISIRHLWPSMKYDTWNVLFSLEVALEMISQTFYLGKPHTYTRTLLLFDLEGSDYLLKAIKCPTSVLSKLLKHKGNGWLVKAGTLLWSENKETFTLERRMYVIY